MVSLKQDKGQQIVEELWEAAKTILRKYNCNTGKDFKAIGMVMITFKADHSIHVSTHGLMSPENAVAALISSFERIYAKETKGEPIAAA